MSSEQKTIVSLNSKWWYRLLKVVFVGAQLLIILLLIGINLGNFAPQFDYEQSFVYCDNGFSFLPTDVGLLVYSNYLSPYDDEKIRNLCARTIVKNADGSLKLTPSTFLPDEKNYKFAAKYTDRNWMGFFGFSVTGILITLLIFEIGRRIFYYVGLGTFRPRKS